MNAYRTTGVIGYPSRATAEKGHAVLDHLGQAAHALITLLTSQATEQTPRGGYRPLTLPSAATHESS
jgi:creatinine amidohydrolase/Fe(II)-dependent formamide hydrolase-like protein